MLGQVWAILKFLQELWEALKVFVGMVEKKQHENRQEEISDATKKAGDTDASDADREDAAHEIEDIINRRT